MKIGISLVRTEKGKIIVRGFEPGGIAAKAGFRSGDELVSIGRKTGKQIPLNEPGGIDFRGGQKVRVLRDGALIDLLIPQREKRSAKYRSLNQALGESYANVDQVVREAYSANAAGAMSDPEVQKLCENAKHTRARQRRAREPQLPLGKSPAEGVGPEGNFYHDQRHWRRQLDEDLALSRLARHIADIVANNYLHADYDGKYFCAYCSIDTLQGRIKRSREEVLKALREIEERGHWKIVRRGGRQSNLLAPQLRTLANLTNLPLGRNDAEPQRPDSIEGHSADNEEVAEPENTQNAALLTAPAGCGIILSRLPRIAKAPSAKVTPESEARRKAEAERRDVVAREREFLEKIYREQAPRGVEVDYDPFAYHTARGSSPLGDFGDYGASSIGPRDRRWYK